jgi:hypothetical protein
METSIATPTDRARFELRYHSLSRHRCGYAFPCDENGEVDLDALSDRALANYLHARAMVGRDLLQPQLLPAASRRRPGTTRQRRRGKGERPLAS